MAYAQGSIVVAPASFKGGRRPYLVVSNATRPFFGDEYTVAVITTTARETAVELTPETLTEGQLDKYPSYVNPWSLHVVQHAETTRRVAQLDDAVLERVADSICEFVRPV